MRTFTRFSKELSASNSGQSLLEFAIATPFLLLLLTASIDFGRYMYDGIELGNGARAGAQYGSQNSTTETDISGMKNAATSDARSVANAVATASSCQCGGTIVTASPCVAPPAYSCPADHTVSYVTVNLSGTFTPLVRIPGLPVSLTISRRAIAQVSP